MILPVIRSAPKSPPIVAQYIVTFLKPEMLHIYRQVTGLQNFIPVVFCQKHENPQAFPFERLVVIPKPRSHPLRRLMQKQILGRPITIYRSEARRILTAIERSQAKLLHIYFGHIAVHLLPLLEISPWPFVVSFHGADAQIDLHKPFYSKAMERVFSLATLLLVRSQSLADRLIAMGASPEKIRLQRTGIPLDDIPFTERIAPPDGDWRFVQACRLIEKKGLETSLRAFHLFLQTFPRAKLTIAGEGPLLDDIQLLAKNLGCFDSLFFPGFLAQSMLRDLYAGSHCFLQPSQLGADGNQEGVPNAMLEAMASGLPILATDHGGIPEAVEDGRSGLLTPERDFLALAESMQRLASDPSRFVAMGKAAAEDVAAGFDLRRQIENLEAIYGEAIAMHANKARPL